MSPRSSIALTRVRHSHLATRWRLSVVQPVIRDNTEMRCRVLLLRCCHLASSAEFAHIITTCNVDPPAPLSIPVGMSGVVDRGTRQLQAQMRRGFSTGHRHIGQVLPCRKQAHQGVQPPCKQANRARPTGGCGVMKKEIFLKVCYYF